MKNKCFPAGWSLQSCSADRVETLLSHLSSVVFFRIAEHFCVRKRPRVSDGLWNHGEGSLWIAADPAPQGALLRNVLHHLFFLPGLRLLILAGLEDLSQASGSGK